MINWLTENYVECFAVVGAACALARAVVYLTPTPKDDQAVEEVTAWLTKLAKIFGLDLTQGNNTKDK